MNNAPHDNDNGSLRQLPPPDPSWNGAYKVGGISLVIAGLAIFAVALLSIVIGPPPSSGDQYLQALATHAVVAQLNFGLFALADVLLLLGTLAIYLSLRQVARNAMLVGTALLALFVVLDLAVTELNSLTLVGLAQSYAATTGEALRSVYLAAAQYALATLPVATFLSYFLSSVGLLIVSIVMLRGVYPRLAAYAGIVGSVAGILGGFYPVIPPLALLLTPSLIAFGLWSLLSGARLYKLGKAQPELREILPASL
jgi:uncharacterized membrane protein YozB (DUF420 family)